MWSAQACRAREEAAAAEAIRQAGTWFDSGRMDEAIALLEQHPVQDLVAADLRALRTARHWGAARLADVDAPMVGN